jgi:hypothetical protein
MKKYYVEYYTENGKKVGMQISAYTALDAKFYAEKMPGFRSMANYPTEID